MVFKHKKIVKKLKVVFINKTAKLFFKAIWRNEFVGGFLGVFLLAPLIIVDFLSQQVTFK